MIANRPLLSTVIVFVLFCLYLAIFRYQLRETSLGVVSHGKVFQVHAQGPLIGEDYLVLSIRNTHGSDDKDEIVLDCAVDVKESLFKEIKLVGVEENGFFILFNNSGFCYSMPLEQIELGGVPIRLTF